MCRCQIYKIQVVYVCKILKEKCAVDYTKILDDTLETMVVEEEDVGLQF